MQYIQVVFLLGFALSINAQMSGGATPLFGIELMKAKGVLFNSLDQLASYGPHYRLIRIISVTQQIVAGTKYEYKVELLDGNDPKICLIEILSRPWIPMNKFDVTLECPDYKARKSHN